MAVASHRNYISSTREDLERAAGRLVIASKAATEDAWANAMFGAAQALYALAEYEIKDEESFLNIWMMLMERGEEVGRD